jgi:hypothetical protein
VESVNVTATPDAPVLTPADRCDRCGAQGRVRVLLTSGDLVFCGHHAKEYEPLLRESAVSWLDDSGLSVG